MYNLTATSDIDVDFSWPVFVWPLWCNAYSKYREIIFIEKIYVTYTTIYYKACYASSFCSTIHNVSAYTMIEITAVVYNYNVTRFRKSQRFVKQQIIPYWNFNGKRWAKQLCPLTYRM